MIEDDDIFENQDAMAENIEESAEAMGISRKAVSVRKRKVLVARNNCKVCFGQGYQRVMPPNSREFVKYPCKCVRVRIL